MYAFSRRFLFFIFPSFFCFASHIEAFAQEKVIDYFDSAWRVLPNENGAAYYRTVKGKPGQYLVKDYYASKQIEMVAECSAYEPYPVFAGKKTNYYENGKASRVSNFVKDVERGISKTYYESGNEKARINYDGKGGRYVSYLSDDGRQLLTDGNGIVDSGASLDGMMFDEIADSVIIGTFVVSTVSDTTYIIVDHPAEYKGGQEVLKRDVQSLIAILLKRESRE